jgi:type IV secretion system protein VirB1
MDITTLLPLLLTCSPHVDAATARALISVESAANPHAIGVVGGALERQPRHRAEALATAQALNRNGWDFSVGLAQINVRNVRRLGLTMEQAFEPCTNLAAMQTLLSDCYARAPAKASGRGEQQALRQALSCYYSGNYSTGFAHGYVRSVELAAARLPQGPPAR